MRHRRFYSLAELNETISELLRQLNDERPIRRLDVTRRVLFEELDRPNLNALPAEPYCFAEWRLRRVGVDSHVELEGHFYSVRYRFARSEVEVRLTPKAVEIFLKGERIAVHLRASGNHRHTTVAEHMPSSHHIRIGVTPGKPLADIRDFGSKVRSYDGIAAVPPIVLAVLRRRMVTLAAEIR